ncbi:MAG: hypothetical protein V7L20_21450 [Nostoc sp.]
MPHTQYFDLPRLTSTSLSTSRLAQVGTSRHKSLSTSAQCPMTNDK